LPTLKEFEELRRMAFSDSEPGAGGEQGAGGQGSGAGEQPPDTVEASAQDSEAAQASMEPASVEEKVAQPQEE